MSDFVPGTPFTDNRTTDKILFIKFILTLVIINIKILMRPVKQYKAATYVTIVMETSADSVQRNKKHYLCGRLEFIRFFPAGLLGDAVVVVGPSIWGLEHTPWTL